MAINRQDYQYIRNTIPGQQNPLSSNKLGIGVTVRNLVAEMTQSSIYNPNYVDYYGRQSMRNKWSCAPSDGMEFTKNFSVEGSSIEKEEDDIYMAQGKTAPVLLQHRIKPDSGISGGGLSGVIIKYTASGSIKLKNNETYVAGSATSNVAAEVVASYNAGSHSVDYSIETLVSRSYTVTIAVKRTVQYYQATIAIDLSEDIQDSDVVQDNWYISGLNNTSISESSFDEETKVFSCIAESLNKKLDGVVHYFLDSDYTISDTIDKGLLLHSVELEPNTSYVLQVLDATEPIGETLPQNRIFNTKTTNTDDTVNDLSFDEYLFFNTGDAIDNIYQLEIYGASFSYKTYHLEDGKLKQLRKFIAPVSTKVYLFKSNEPWVVDKKGTIVALNSCKLRTTQQPADDGLDASFDDSDIRNLFSKPPQLKISTTNKEADTLSILLPESESNSSEWKHFAPFKESTSNLKNQLCLLVYRNYLTQSSRDYRVYYTRTSKGEGHSPLKQYGLIRCLQKTQINTDDNVASSLKVKLQLFPMLIKPEEKTTTSINMLMNEETISVNDSGLYRDTISLPILSLFGYNRAYSSEKNLDSGQNEDLPYQYTSVSFAWGLQKFEPSKKEGECVRIKYEKLSEWSEPVLIDRSITSITKSDDLITLTPSSYKIEKLAHTDYYDPMAIYINKLHEEENEEENE